MPEINWNLIIKALKTGKCLLIMGHDAVLMPDKKTPLYQYALSSVAESFSKEVIYNPGDEFIYVNPRISDQVYDEIADAFKQQTAPSFYKSLAEIPFFMFLNTSPDLYLREIFKEKTDEGFQFLFDYYQTQALPDFVPKTNSESPLLYNLFGNVDFPNSMIFSYDKLFNYLDSMMTLNYKLHPSMVTQIREAKSIIFIGFKFNKVYFNLILWLLGFQDIKQKKLASGNLYDEALLFVQEHFAIDFVSSNIAAFVGELHDKCKTEGILRDFSAPLAPIIDLHKFSATGENKVKNELIDMVHELAFDKLFHKLQELDIKTPMLKTFQDEHISNRKSSDYENRVLTFIDTLNI